MGTTTPDIIDISLNIASPPVTGAGFGTPLIFAETVKQKGRITGPYTSLASLTDGTSFESSDDVYKMATDMLAQDETVDQFYVGKKKTAQNATITITFDADATGGSFTLDISKTEGAAETTGAIAFDDSAATVETTIESNSNVSSVTCTVNDSNPGDVAGITLEFDGADAETDFEINAVDVSSLTAVTTATITQDAYGEATETYTSAMTALLADSDAENFYCIIPETRTKATLLLVASAIESEQKILVQQTASSDVKDGTADNLAEELKGNAYDRTVTVYATGADNHVASAWAGKCLPLTAGGINWANQVLSSVTTESLTASEVSNLAGNNCNRFETVGGYNIVPGWAAGGTSSSGGITASGEFIDTIRGGDQLVTKMQERLIYLLVENDKVPFTQAGFDMVESNIRRIMNLYGEQTGFLVEDSVDVDMPDLDTYDATKKANRQLDGIVVTATLAGAINYTGLSINISS